MKIAFATPYYVSGFGIENRITELIGHLPPDIEKAILCRRYSRVPPEGTSVIRLPLFLHLLTGSRNVRFSSIALKIQNAYFKPFMKDFDVIDSQFYPMTALPNIGKKVITWHSVTFEQYAKNPNEAVLWSKEYQTMLQNMSSADLVVPVSRWAEKEVHRFDPSIPTCVLPNGVDLKKFKFKRKDQRGKTLVSLGRFTPHKGQLEVLSIFKQVKDELKDKSIKLVLAGKNSNRHYFNQVKRYAQLVGDGDITIISDIPDDRIPDIYQLGDIFLSCSHWEGFGMPMIEAQICGLPALGYAICSHPEVVANQAFLSEEHDLSAIAENIIKLFSDDEFYWRSAISARLFAEKYDWNIIADQYQSILRSLIES